MGISQKSIILSSDVTTILDNKQDKFSYTPVKSVNGVEADESGNISIASTERFTFPDYSAGVTKSWKHAIYSRSRWVGVCKG